MLFQVSLHVKFTTVKYSLYFSSNVLQQKNLLKFEWKGSEFNIFEERKNFINFSMLLL